MYNILENSATNRAKKSWKDKVHNERNSFQFSILLWMYFNILFLTYFFNFISSFVDRYLLTASNPNVPIKWISPLLDSNSLCSYFHSKCLVNCFYMHCIRGKVWSSILITRFKQNLHSNDLLKPSIKWLFAGWKNGE